LEIKRTGQDKEDDPVHDEDRPEDGDVEDLEPAAHEADSDSPGRGVPELELGKAADEGAELLVLLGGKTSSASIFHIHRVIEGLDRGVELGLEEGKEQVEQVDSERVGNWDGLAVYSVYLDRCTFGTVVVIPMYQPCATKTRRKKIMRSAAVPIHRYVTKGVDLSR
jgi:hypothetical protein